MCESCSTQAEKRIRTLKHAYWRASDIRDVAAFRACFVSRGGEVDFGPLGTTDPDGMTQVFRAVAAERHPDGGPRYLDMHHGLMPSIEVDPPSRATGRWTLQFRQLDRVARTETVMTGEYHDVYTVEDDAWRILSSRFQVGWAMTRPLEAEASVSWNDEIDLTAKGGQE